MPDIQQTLDKLMTLPMFDASPPATADEIDRIEAELGVTLPAQYVEFLRRFGYAGWFGREILGVRPIDPTTGRPSTVTSNCVKKTREQRDPENRLGTAWLHSAHLVVSTDGGGHFVLFAAGSPYEGEVHWYNFEDQVGPIKTWKTFQDYLEYEIRNALGEDAASDEPTRRAEWRDIERQLRELDGETNDSVLIECRGDDYMGIAGGNENRYVVAGYIEGEGSFICASGPDGPAKQVAVCNDFNSYPSINVVDLGTAILAAEEFFDTGALSEKLKWTWKRRVGRTDGAGPDGITR